MAPRRPTARSRWRTYSCASGRRSARRNGLLELLEANGVDAAPILAELEAEAEANMAAQMLGGGDTTAADEDARRSGTGAHGWTLGGGAAGRGATPLRRRRRRRRGRHLVRLLRRLHDGCVGARSPGGGGGSAGFRFRSGRSRESAGGHAAARRAGGIDDDARRDTATSPSTGRSTAWSSPG